MHLVFLLVFASHIHSKLRLFLPLQFLIGIFVHCCCCCWCCCLPFIHIAFFSLSFICKLVIYIYILVHFDISQKSLCIFCCCCCCLSFSSRSQWPFFINGSHFNEKSYRITLFFLLSVLFGLLCKRCWPANQQQQHIVEWWDRADETEWIGWKELHFFWMQQRFFPVGSFCQWDRIENKDITRWEDKKTLTKKK